MSLIIILIVSCLIGSQFGVGVGAIAFLVILLLS